MNDIVFVDPKNWLCDFGLKTKSLVYANPQDGLKHPGFHVMINDFINPINFQPNDYDLILYNGLENINCFSKLHSESKTYAISPTASVDQPGWDTTHHFCHPAYFYSGAHRYKTAPPKPNYDSKFLADALIGRISQNKIGRAWCYYQVLFRGWKDQLLITARKSYDPMDLDPHGVSPSAWKFLCDSKKLFGDINADYLPDYNSYEHTELQNQFVEQGLDPFQVFPDFFSHDTDISIPAGIYKNSLYSLVMSDNNAVYFDEKIVKPILCRRPFIVIGPQGYLNELRSLGFQTFDPVIDESYDQIADDQERWTRAFDSLGKLASQNPQSVYDRLRKRLQHNRKLAYNSEYWISKLKNYLNSIIKKHTGQQCVIY